MFEKNMLCGFFLNQCKNKFTKFIKMGKFRSKVPTGLKFYHKKIYHCLEALIGKYTYPETKSNKKSGKSKGYNFNR